MRSRLGRAAAMLLVLCCLLPLAALGEGEPSQTVRVGWYLIAGVMETDADGEHSGYCYDYLKEMARYTDVTYEFVEGSWRECLQRLGSGEIDVLPFTQYSISRDAYLDFTESPMGQAYATLTMLRDNPNIIPGDQATYAGRRIGAVRGSAQVEQLSGFMEDNGLRCTLTLFESMEEMTAALSAGQIDLVVHSSFRTMEPDETIVERFAPSRFYFAVQQGNSALLTLLDGAMEQIESYDSGFATRTKNKYFPTSAVNNLRLSGEDRKLIAALGALNILSYDEAGYQAWQDESGAVRGVDRAIAATLAELLGMELDQRAAAAEELEAAKRSGETVVVAGYPFDYTLAEQDGASLTTPYMTASYYCIEQVGHGEREYRTVAMPLSLQYLTRDTSLFANKEIYWTAGMDEALQAVVSGRTDAAYGESVTSDYLMDDMRFRGLNSHLLDVHHSLCFAVYGPDAHQAALLFSKAVSSLGSECFSDLVTAEHPVQSSRTTLREFIADRPEFFAGVVVVFAALLVAVYVGLRHVRDRQRNTDYQEILRTKAHLEETQSSMEAAISNADILYFEYFPDRHSAMEYNGRDHFGVPEEMTDYPESWFRMGLTHPEDEPVLREAFQRLDAGEDSWRCEVRNLVDGTYRWHRYLFTAIFSAEGRRIKVACTATDVTLQREAEESYRRQLEAVRRMDPDTVAAFRLDLTGNSSTQTMGSPLMETGNAAEDTEALFAALAAGIHGAEERECFAACFDRERLLTDFRRGRSEVSLTQRMTVGGQPEKWLRALLRMFENPLNGSVEAVMALTDVDGEVREKSIVQHLTNLEYDYIALIGVADRSFRVQNFSSEMTAHDALCTGCYDTDLAGLLAIILPEDRERCARELDLHSIADHLAQADVYTVSFREWAGEQTAENIRYKRQRYSRLGGEPGVILMLKQDVTREQLNDRRRMDELEKALKCAEEASLAKTDFLSNMSHEIRTPMNAIIGMTKLAEEEAAPDTELSRYLTQIDTASDYLLGVINDILDMSRIESGKFTLNLGWYTSAEVIMPCLDMIEHAAAAKGVSFVYPPSCRRTNGLECYVDMLKTRQMFMNLLNNACKFTPAGGTVTLAFHNVRYDAQTATDEAVISDTGCGMSADFLTRIFTPFEQERNVYTGAVQGTGLGLALARRIAREMGGDIQVESTLGKGSTFTVRFTYHYRRVGEGTDTAAEPVCTDADLTGRHILLAEDHPLNAVIAQKLLEKRGMVVARAENGRQALELVERNAPGTFDAVLMDVRMPVMDGLEAARRIRALPREDAKTLPIIAMTANAFDEDKQRSHAAGMDDHLAKPVDPEKLYHTLARFIGKR